MKFDKAVDLFVADMWSRGSMASANTELAYRTKLNLHSEDVGNRDPSKTGREDVKRTLRRWTHPNSQRQAHAILRSFYDYAMEEGWRKDNPARQVRKAKGREPEVYRLTRAEVVALMNAAQGARRDRWVVRLGVCAGLRSQELRGLQGRHLMRPGWVWVSSDIGKGSKERWMPVLAELEPVVEEILTFVAVDEYVVPGRSHLDPPHNTKFVEDPKRRLSASALYKQVQRLGHKARLPASISPHTLRHAYGDHVARYAGLRAAQSLLGHASVQTTAGTYTDKVTLDELAASVQGFSYGRLPTTQRPEMPHG